MAADAGERLGLGSRSTRPVSHFFSFPARLAARVGPISGPGLLAIMAHSVAMSFPLIFRRSPAIMWRAFTTGGVSAGRKRAET